jgi:hypothetical protein
MIATITTDPLDRDSAIVRFPYDARAVDAIKTIPGRRWDKARKVWSIPIDLAGIARRELEAVGLTVRNELRSKEPPPPPPPPPPPKLTNSATVDHLVRVIPREQQKRFLRALAAATHPDVGGDLELSKYVNALKDRPR